MPIILERLLATPFGKMVVGFVLYGLAAASNMFVRPMLDSLAHKRGSFLSKTLVGLGARYISKGIGWVEHRTRSYISHWAAANLHPLIRLFHGLAWVVNDVNKTLLGLSASHEHVTARLRYHTIPTAVHKGVAPVRHRLHAFAHATDLTLAREQARIARLGHGIDRLRIELHDVVLHRLHGIDRLLRDTVLPRLKVLGHELDVVIPRELQGIRTREKALAGEVAGVRARTKALERKLTKAGAAALVLAALGTLGLKWLRCRNVNNLGRRLCGLPTGELDWILGGLIDVLVIADVCEIMLVLEEAVGAFEPVLQELVALEDLVCLAGGATLPSAV